ARRERYGLLQRTAGKLVALLVSQNESALAGLDQEGHAIRLVRNLELSECELFATPCVALQSEQGRGQARRALVPACHPLADERKAVCHFHGDIGLCGFDGLHQDFARAQDLDLAADRTVAAAQSLGCCLDAAE